MLSKYGKNFIQSQIIRREAENEIQKEDIEKFYKTRRLINEKMLENSKIFRATFNKKQDINQSPIHKNCYDNNCVPKLSPHFKRNSIQGSEFSIIDRSVI